MMRGSYTDPDLYRAMCFKTWENEIPKCCNRQLICDYLEKNSIEDFSFSVFNNELKVRYSGLGELQKERLHLLKQYIQSGEQLANTNRIEVIVKGGLLAAIAMGSLITIALCIFIPSLVVSLATIVPLVIMAAGISIILFCCMSVPQYAEISATKKRFRVCEENLRNTLACIRETSLRPSCLASYPSEASNQIQAETQTGAIDMPSTSSSSRFFPKRLSISHSLGEHTSNVDLQSSMSLSARDKS